MTDNEPSTEDPGGDGQGESARPAPIDAAATNGTRVSDARTESTLMIEAHAPHVSIHTWKDFAIHVATICVGLLIAIGLEQSVEYFHHRRQLQEARQELALEIEDNRAKVVRALQAVQQEILMLDADMASLRAAQGMRDPTWPKLEYSWRGPEWPEDGGWKALRQGGTLALMPHDELRRYSYVYDGIAAVQVAFTTYAAQSDMAESLAQRSARSKVLPTELQEMMAATAQCQGRLKFFASTLRLEKVGLEAISRHDTD